MRLLLEGLSVQLSEGRLSCSFQPSKGQSPAVPCSGGSIAIAPWTGPEAHATAHTPASSSSSSSSGSSKLGRLEDAAVRGVLYSVYCILVQLTVPDQVTARQLQESFREALEAAEAGRAIGFTGLERIRAARQQTHGSAAGGTPGQPSLELAPGARRMHAAAGILAARNKGHLAPWAQLLCSSAFISTAALEGLVAGRPMGHEPGATGHVRCDAEPGAAGFPSAAPLLSPKVLVLVRTLRGMSAAAAGPGPGPHAAPAVDGGRQEGSRGSTGWAAMVFVDRKVRSRSHGACSLHGAFLSMRGR